MMVKTIVGIVCLIPLGIVLLGLYISMWIDWFDEMLLIHILGLATIGFVLLS